MPEVQFPRRPLLGCSVNGEPICYSRYESTLPIIPLSIKALGPGQKRPFARSSTPKSRHLDTHLDRKYAHGPSLMHLYELGLPNVERGWQPSLGAAMLSLLIQRKEDRGSTHTVRPISSSHYHNGPTSCELRRAEYGIYRGE
jgi:hypothetical protein